MLAHSFCLVNSFLSVLKGVCSVLRCALPVDSIGRQWAADIKSEQAPRDVCLHYKFAFCDQRGTLLLPYRGKRRQEGAVAWLQKPLYSTAANTNSPSHLGFSEELTIPTFTGSPHRELQVSCFTEMDVRRCPRYSNWTGLAGKF